MSESPSMIENYFVSKDIMSVHIRLGAYPLVKRGKPGEWELPHGLMEYGRIFAGVLVSEPELSRSEVPRINAESEIPPSDGARH